MNSFTTLRCILRPAHVVLLLAIVLTAAHSTGHAGAANAKTPVDFVDPFIGTAAHGHTYPGATVPFGMVQLSPDGGKSGWDWCSGYHASDSAIAGFSHTHLSGTGCCDLGDILITPTTAASNLDRAYRSPISHDDEQAEPGYYRVRLLDHDIQAELTATDRCGFHRYTFPASDSACLIFNLGFGQDDTPIETFLKIEDDSTLVGYRFSKGWARDHRVFFAAKLSRPIQSWLCGDGDSLLAGQREATGKYIRAALYFRTANKEAITLKVGISPVSMDGAKRNLEAEIAGWDFEQIRLAARAKWQKALGRISVETGSDADKTVFYTALYHSLLAPTLWCDADGQYRGPDGAVHAGDDHQHYSTFSLWDTYRAAHPLYTIIEPQRVRDMIRTMLAFYKESGRLPIWTLADNETECMIGYHSVPVIYDAWQKGLRDFDAKLALEAMQRSAEDDQRGLRYYNNSRPVSFEEQKHQLASKFGMIDTTALALPTAGGESWPILAGWAKTDSGQVVTYPSAYSQANHPLLAYATDPPLAVQWQTAAVPRDTRASAFTFVWLAGIGVHGGGHTFTLSVNDDPCLTFTTATSPTRLNYEVTGDKGVRLAFQTTRLDAHGNLFGNMYLTVPRALCTPGAPLRLTVAGEAAAGADWVLIYPHAFTPQITLSNENCLQPDTQGAGQLLRVEIESLAPQADAVVYTEGGPRVQTRLLPGLTTVMLPVALADSARRVIVHVTSGGSAGTTAECLFEPIKTFGYVPADREPESASKTLEYAYDDWCVAQMANALGETDDYQRYMKRAANYRNLFDSTTGFIRGRKFDGSWVSPFDPRCSMAKQPEYTEANAWQYTWSVPQDVQGLISLMGGRERFAAKLDSLFAQSTDLEGTGASIDMSGLIGMYAHGNEPSHHIAYLYNYAGEPWKSQERVNHILRDFYKPTRDGLAGNDDCGQMSAWYVFSAMGFYPVNPAEGIYVIGAPLLPKVIINGNFTVTANQLSLQNKYVQSARLNGQPLTRCYITHTELMRGGTLEFTMGDKPNTRLWTNTDAVPPSMSEAVH